jgi:hypothetical protein
MRAKRKKGRANFVTKTSLPLFLKQIFALLLPMERCPAGDIERCHSWLHIWLHVTAFRNPELPHAELLLGCHKDAAKLSLSCCLVAAKSQQSCRCVAAKMQLKIGLRAFLQHHVMMAAFHYACGGHQREFRVPVQVGQREDAAIAHGRLHLVQ